ncbi:MAG TPA: DUF808 family protein, partial [Pirellulaceae bacterium]|nr:DUF808 family protein [Pirellulaceae bacterium]
AHKWMHHKSEDDAEHHKLVEAIVDPQVDVVAVEKEKIQGAVRTDFVLSAEIIAITLGTVAEEPFLEQVLVLVGIALIMTVGVYGLVAGIVKLDDLGLYLTQRTGKSIARKLLRATGVGILLLAPYLMKGLSIVGTAAMFMVGGGILTHGLPIVHNQIHHLAEELGHVPGVGKVLEFITPSILDALFGIAAGAVVLLVVVLCSRAYRAVRR